LFELLYLFCAITLPVAVFVAPVKVLVFLKGITFDH